LDDALSSDGIEPAFDVLGLKIERFNITVPERTHLRFSTRQYVNGEVQARNASGSIWVDEGLQDLILFISHADNAIRLSIQAGGGRVGVGSASLECFDARTWGCLAGDSLMERESNPIYYFAANTDGVQSPETRTVDALAAKYDFVIILFAQIE